MSKTRQVVLYLKATGHKPEEFDQITEISCLEIVDQKLTGKEFHSFINLEKKTLKPEDKKNMGADYAKLAKAPHFKEVAEALLTFIDPKKDGKTNLIIHNAVYNDRHLNYAMLAIDPDWTTLCMHAKVIDLMELARRINKFNEVKAAVNLDALSQQYGVNNQNRSHYSAQQDAKLVAQIYLKMQPSIVTILDKLCAEQAVAYSKQDISGAQQRVDKLYELYQKIFGKPAANRSHSAGFFSEKHPPVETNVNNSEQTLSHRR